MAIHQEITIDCSRERIYRALTQGSEFAAATGASAEIDATDGGAFSCFNGQIAGRNIELDDGRMIVQAWRVAAWPAGVYSTVRLTLDDDESGTTLTLDQSGHPDDAEEHLAAGWHKMYWEPLRNYCA